MLSPTPVSIREEREYTDNPVKFHSAQYSPVYSCLPGSSSVVARDLLTTQPTSTHVRLAHWWRVRHRHQRTARSLVEGQASLQGPLTVHTSKLLYRKFNGHAYLFINLFIYIQENKYIGDYVIHSCKAINTQSVLLPTFKQLITEANYIENSSNNLIYLRQI